jgi:hypothetical protein
MYSSPITNEASDALDAASAEEGEGQRYQGFSEITLVFISKNPTSFPELRTQREAISKGLNADTESLMNTIEESLYAIPYTIEDIDPALPDLVHFIYKSLPTSRLCHSPFKVAPYLSKKSQQKLFRKYQHVHSRVSSYDRKTQEPFAVGSKSVYYEASPRETMLAWIRADEFMLMATFSPLTTKENAITSCNRLLRWLKREEHTLFLD